MQDLIRLYDLRTQTLCSAPRGDFVLALGNFDGVHSAHRVLLHRAARLAKVWAKDKPTYSAAWFFDPPSSDFLGKSHGHLTTLQEKLSAFAECGMDYAYLADFSSLRSLSPDRFIDEVLKQHARAVHIVCGYHFHFGQGGAGNALTLQRAFGQACVDVVPSICLPIAGQETVISASSIRASLAQGDVENAARLLGRPYSLTAPVTHGKQLGRVLGFPTINQNAPEGKLLPKEGIYVTRCYVDGEPFGGVTNVGHRPTVDGIDSIPNCETHILDLERDLYGKSVTVEFLHRLRDEQKFETVELLKAAVTHDIEQARKYYKGQ